MGDGILLYLSYSVLYLRVLVALTFLLSLCTQPPFSVVVGLQEILPLHLVCMEEDSSTFGFFVCSSGVSSVCWNTLSYTFNLSILLYLYPTLVFVVLLQ